MVSETKIDEIQLYEERLRSYISMTEIPLCNFYQTQFLFQNNKILKIYKKLKLQLKFVQSLVMSFRIRIVKLVIGSHSIFVQEHLKT